MNIQDLVVYAVVLGAVMYLGRALLASTVGKKSCGSCGSGKKCGTPAVTGQNGTAEPQLIQIGLGSGFTAGLNGQVKHHSENAKPEK